LEFTANTGAIVKALFIAAACLSLPFVAARAQTDRVGTFDRQSIVIAYYRSPMYAVTLKERIAARDSAKRTGDSARVRELEAWGARQQETAHEQLAGNAPITNILDALRPVLDSLTKAANLRNIAQARPEDARAGVVDVTPALLDWLKADAKTREIISQMPRSRR
jgi:hypothetical protein